MTRTSSLSERPGRHQRRRLADWLNPTGARKVHSLVDKIYQRKNLVVAWEKVKSNRGGGGIDGEDLAAFEVQLEANLARLHQELKDGTYAAQPVREHLIPKAGKPGKPGQYRALGIPTIYDRVCQQALLNRLEPIFEPVFDEANFGYRRGRSARGALGKIWRELQQGSQGGQKYDPLLFLADALESSAGGRRWPVACGGSPRTEPGRDAWSDHGPGPHTRRCNKSGPDRSAGRS